MGPGWKSPNIYIQGLSLICKLHSSILMMRTSLAGALASLIMLSTASLLIAWIPLGASLPQSSPLTSTHLRLEADDKSSNPIASSQNLAGDPTASNHWSSQGDRAEVQASGVPSPEFLSLTGPTTISVPVLEPFPPVTVTYDAETTGPLNPDLFQWTVIHWTIPNNNTLGCYPAPQIVDTVTSALVVTWTTSDLDCTDAGFGIGIGVNVSFASFPPYIDSGGYLAASDFLYIYSNGDCIYGYDQWQASFPCATSASLESWGIQPLVGDAPATVRYWVNATGGGSLSGSYAAEWGSNLILYPGLVDPSATEEAEILGCGAGPHPVSPDNYTTSVLWYPSATTYYTSAGCLNSIGYGTESFWLFNEVSAMPSGGPSIIMFKPTPAVVIPNQPTDLNVTALDSNLTLNYTYTGLPPGCITMDVPSLKCVPTAPGRYFVRVFVNDSFGRSANETTLLVVEPASTTTFTESGLPAGTWWSVTLNGTVKNATQSSISFTDAIGIYDYRVAPISGYDSTPSSGVLSISGPNQTINISFTPTRGTGGGSAGGFLGMAGNTGYLVAGGTATAAVVGFASAFKLKFPRRKGTP